MEGGKPLCLKKKYVGHQPPNPERNLNPWAACASDAPNYNWLHDSLCVKREQSPMFTAPQFHTILESPSELQEKLRKETKASLYCRCWDPSQTPHKDWQETSPSLTLPNPILNLLVLVDLVTYITRFQWDMAKYPIKQSLKNISEIIAKVRLCFSKLVF